MVWLPLWLVELSSQNNLCWWLCWEQAGRCSWASHSACFINESHLLRGRVRSGLGSLEKVTHASRGWQLIHPSHVLRVCLLRHHADWVLGVRTNDTFSLTSRVTFKLLFLKDHSGFAHWVPVWLHPYRRVCISRSRPRASPVQGKFEDRMKTPLLIISWDIMEKTRDARIKCPDSSENAKRF